MKDAKYKFLGMYGESPDITGGMGGEGVDAFAKFLDGGGTLIAMGNAVRFPAELGFARTVDASAPRRATSTRRGRSSTPRSCKLDHPVFYGYTEKIMPIKYLGGPLMTVGAPDQAGVLARYVGGDDAVLSGLMKGADEIRQRPFAVDVPGGFTRQGPRRPLREQSDLPLAEPRRVQHGVQRRDELERHGDGRTACARVDGAGGRPLGKGKAGPRSRRGQPQMKPCVFAA